ncbi:MAG: class I SAM-dependent methyltransferase [Patescibacteria group bacterium]
MNNNEPNPKEFYDTVMPDKFGKDYESVRWEGTPLQSAQYDMTAEMICTRVLPVLKNATSILEVGPGPGTWTKLLLTANPNARFTLVDISTTMLAQAKRALPQHTAIAFIESDIMQFSTDEKFDGFFSSRAIEYMPDKNVVAAKIFSLLSSGAYGAIITKTPKYFFDRLRGRKVADLHRGQIAPRELMKKLRDAELEIVGVYAATATIPLIGSVFLNRLMFRLIQRLPLFYPLTLLTESYCVVFKKP